MAKKIAAPRKAASKAPARKTAKAKAVSAPKTHKPKGSPKERLAYLNKQEMAALVKRKGTPARKGPKGLPSFADDSASSTGMSRGDKSGTKGSSSSGNTSGVGGGGGGGGGASGSRGSSTGGVGAGNGSNAPGNGGGGQRGPGGPSGPNSAASGTRGIGGPSSPMGGQGTSFATPKAARDDTLRRAYGIEDQRGLQNMPQRPYPDRKYGGMINPNLPPVDREKIFRDRLAARDEEARRMGDWDMDDYRNPQEVRANAERMREYMDEEDARISAANRGLKKSAPLSQENFRTNVTRAAASGRTPDVKLGGPRSGSSGGGYSGGGMGGTARGGGWSDDSYNNGRGGSGWKAGGLVKPKTFKKK